MHPFRWSTVNKLTRQTNTQRLAVITFGVDAEPLVCWRPTKRACIFCYWYRYSSLAKFFLPSSQYFSNSIDLKRIYERVAVVEDETLRHAFDSGQREIGAYVRLECTQVLSTGTDK